MDFVKDQSGRHLLRLSQVMQVPEYVKASTVNAEALETLSNAQYGVPHQREFPLDNPGHVFLSYGYYKSANMQTPDLLARILKAASFFSIEADLAQIDTALSTLTKEASQAKRYAITIDFGSADATSEVVAIKQGGLQSFYPINTDSEVEQSAIKLANDRHKLPLEVFVQASRNIIKTAREMRLSFDLLPRKVVEYGVERLPHPELVTKIAAGRSAVTQDPLYEDLAKTAIANPEEKSAYDYANLWMQLDRANGYKAASKHDPDAYQILNSGPTLEQVENEIQKWTVIQNTAVPVEKIAHIRSEDMVRLFPKKAVEVISQLVKQASAGLRGSELVSTIQQMDTGWQRVLLKHLLAS